MENIMEKKRCEKCGMVTYCSPITDDDGETGNACRHCREVAMWLYDHSMAFLWSNYRSGGMPSDEVDRRERRDGR